MYHDAGNQCLALCLNSCPAIVVMENIFSFGSLFSYVNLIFYLVVMLCITELLLIYFYGIFIVGIFAMHLLILHIVWFGDCMRIMSTVSV